MVASCGYTWVPVEQEGLVNILGECFGSDGDSAAHRGKRLAQGQQSRDGRPPLTEWLWTLPGAEHAARWLLWASQPWTAVKACRTHSGAVYGSPWRWQQQRWL